MHIKQICDSPNGLATETTNPTATVFESYANLYAEILQKFNFAF
jgi:hypothetical protein